MTPTTNQLLELINELSQANHLQQIQLDMMQEDLQALKRRSERMQASIDHIVRQPL